MIAIIGIALFTVLFLSACSGGKEKQQAQESKSSALNDSVWVTAYQGTLPCADCPGIKTTLRLIWTKTDKKGNTYELKEEYIDRNTFTSSGNFNVERGFGQDNDATVIILNFDKPKNEQRYYVYFSNNTKVLHVLNPQKEMNENSGLNYQLEEIE